MQQWTQLYFKRLTREAQLAAIQRLALCGVAAKQIADATGWSPEEVSRVVDSVDMFRMPPASAKAAMQSTHVPSRRERHPAAAP
jgi:hypothetical protein